MGMSPTETDPVDLLVLGGGMAGMTAAARAARDGATVVLVEKGEAIGGSAAYAGFIWTAPTREVMHDVNPDGDPALADRVVEAYDEGIAWVRSLGVEVKDPVAVLGYGLRLGLAAGGAFTGDGAGFYGHLIPSRVAYGNPLEFTDLTFYHSEHGVLLNLEGRRFCDETLGDHLSTLRVLEQPEARALLVTDQRVHDEWMLAPYVEGVEPLDKFALAYRRGARAAIAEDIDEFEAPPPDWGYLGPAGRP